MSPLSKEIGDGRLQLFSLLSAPPRPEAIANQADEVSWLERHQAPDRAYETVLYLGCNILRTPHIAKQVVDVFSHLKLDFIAVGGAQYCCGIVWDKFDGPKKAARSQTGLSPA